MPDIILLYVINFNNILSEIQNNYMQPDSYVMLYLACCKLLEREEKSKSWDFTYFSLINVYTTPKLFVYRLLGM